MVRKLVAGLILPALALAFVGCDVEQTKEGRLPDVDVDVQEGQLPEFDVETADVEVGEKKVDVKVPDVDVDVGTKDAEITVPDVDIIMPDEKPGADEMPAAPSAQ